jgi:predicted RNA binding protein YcfA (HicA-like mRNA interferase family)
MNRFASHTGRQVIKALKQAGFVVTRVRGSHHFLKHTDGRATVVPVHGRETIGPGLLNKILHDVELTREEFESLF